MRILNSVKKTIYTIEADEKWKYSDNYFIVFDAKGTKEEVFRTIKRIESDGLACVNEWNYNLEDYSYSIEDIKKFLRYKERDEEKLRISRKLLEEIQKLPE